MLTKLFDETVQMLADSHNDIIVRGAKEINELNIEA
jgi:hypothetical protein